LAATAPQPHPGVGLLAGKTAIITGTAMGLGKAMARVFVREGAKVLAADFDPSNAASLADIGPDCVPFHTDIRDEADVLAMFAKAQELFGRVDILVNNAGTIATGGDTHLSVANYEEFTRTNFLGAMLCTRVAVDTMIPQGGGVIVNVSSVGSLNCEDRAPIVYSAAKAAVNSMTKAIAVKYGAQGIRANVLAPGFTHSEKTLAASREVIAPMEQKSAFGRAGDAEEQAQVAVFLASDRSSYVNGVVIPVDGGWSARMA
jgi:NAD(P)-dependent dehydrogenase (short-subunit alcohol dehydrogenase family)